MTVVCVRNTLPQEIVAIDRATLERALTLSEIAGKISVNTAEDLLEADRIYINIDTLNKAICAQRLEITRPIDALKAQVIEAERQATIPLKNAKESLGKKMLACKAELEKRRADSEEEARQIKELFGEAQKSDLVVSAGYIPKISPRKRTTYRVEIFNCAALIEAACKNCGKLLEKQVLLVDEKIVRELLEAGCAIPGARLVEAS